MSRKKRRRYRSSRSLAPIHSYRHPKVSVIIPVKNEVRTIARVIREAGKVHKRTEVIVVANGSTDGSKEVAKRMGARVISYRKPLGHDVGRSVGARKARGNILLFTDGDIVIPAYKLRRLVRAVRRGTDVALNKYMGRIANRKVHSVVLAKYALNTLLSRPSLRGASLTTIPHAMSRRALEQIGTSRLAVPPKAQAAAIAAGLKIRAVTYIDVGRTNPRKRGPRGGPNPVKELILGDHLEAIYEYIRRTGKRGRHTDLKRQRSLL
ncbi:hypothetical protein J31TS4_17730 [Paenibacillus sp. J31TS4]|uniref:glycosyltransferase family 2 protein n=1 Tax=Paenibacillus sp. J31TS4 TaxID=2807195 RepID=UPI001B0F8655|nr:glycosyltransferase family A protein [Paenibacillus sp. J31TS4]GIP38493.1 hypothetical protein J31TS4_17730 [Paenibacillus sp. J31TS4]